MRAKILRATQLHKELEAIDTKFEHSDNVWLKHYMSLENYNEITNEITTLQKELKSHHTNPPRSLFTALRHCKDNRIYSKNMPSTLMAHFWR